MKKIIYGILVCIILIGAIITFTIGLNVDIIYSKNVEIDIFVGQVVDTKEIKQIAKEIFANENIIVQKIELFDDMVSITMKDKSDEELKEQINQLNTKINEKYGTENKVEEDITVRHNPKIRLSSVIKPYILPIVISIILILIFVGFRYKKFGFAKTVANYLVHIGIIELLYLSILAITRFPINRLVIPVGLVLYVIIVTTLSFKNEKKLAQVLKEEKNSK